MAVGTLAGMHVSVGSTYIDITFTRPSNCTKIVFIVTPTNLVGAAISHTYTIPLVYAPNASITYRFTGLSSTQTYYLTGTPYNGSAAGTVRNYSNSGSTPVNSIRMPSAKITTPTPTSSTTVKSPTTSSSGSGAVSPTSPVGSTTNNGTVATSGAAATNTPKIIPGATDATVPSDLNSPSRLSLKIPDLAPNQTYSIKVRALTTDSAGKTVYSEYSSPIYLTTPGFGADGTNILSLNNNGDLQLAGGSIFAGDFGVDAGLIDVVNGTTTGTGVILNKTGLAGFAAGTKEFYIDAATGNAYFAGTIQATIIESTAYDGVTDGSAFSNNGMAINLNNGSITAEQFRIDSSGNAYFNGDVSSAKIDNLTGSQVRALAADAKSSATIAYGAATSAANAATVAQDTANGKNKVTYSNRAPLSTDVNKAGDIWWQYDSGIVIGQWSGTGGTTGNYGWDPVQLGSLVIAAIDAGKITAGIIKAGMTITAPTINGGVITGGTFKTSNSNAHVEIGNSSYTDAIIFKNDITSSISGTILPAFDDSGANGLVIHSGSNPTAGATSTNGVSMYWTGRDYWSLQYQGNLPLIKTQFNAIYSWQHFMVAYNGQSSYPSYGSSGYSRARNIDYGATGTTTPSDTPPSVGNGDIYLGY
jgi:hypothetical protein